MHLVTVSQLYTLYLLIYKCTSIHTIAERNLLLNEGRHSFRLSAFSPVCLLYDTHICCHINLSNTYALSHTHIFTYPRCLTQQSVKGKILPTIVWHSVQIWSVCFVVSKKNGTKKNGKNKIGLKSSSWLISQVTPILIIHVKAQGWVDVLVLTSVCWQCGHWGITVGWREVRKFWMSTATVESPIWRPFLPQCA